MHQSASYAQSPFSPIASPVASLGPHGQEHNVSALARQPSTGTQLTRPRSDGHYYPSYDAAAGPARHLNYSASVFAMSQESGGTYPSSEYVDLRRTSVTPFQAAQYAEISKRLNTEVPNGITSAEYARAQEKRSSLAVLATEERSPFDDPIPSSLRPAEAVRNSMIDRPFSVESHSTMFVAQEFDFPEPPSPALTVASRFRVDSTPPKLPEIDVDSRVSVHSSLGSESAGGLLSAKGAGPRSPLAPSPLATSFAVPSPSPENVPLPTTPTVATSAGAAGSAVSTKEPRRPETVYDPEDAYGGI